MRIWLTAPLMRLVGFKVLPLRRGSLVIVKIDPRRVRIEDLDRLKVYLSRFLEPYGACCVLVPDGLEFDTVPDPHEEPAR